MWLPLASLGPRLRLCGPVPLPPASHPRSALVHPTPCLLGSSLGPGGGESYCPRVRAGDTELSQGTSLPARPLEPRRPHTASTSGLTTASGLLRDPPTPAATGHPTPALPLPPGWTPAGFASFPRGTGDLAVLLPFPAALPCPHSLAGWGPRISRAAEEVCGGVGAWDGWEKPVLPGAPRPPPSPPFSSPRGILWGGALPCVGKLLPASARGHL